MRQGERSRHHAETEPTNGTWHYKAMDLDPAPQRECAKNHRKGKSDFMNPMRAKRTAGRREESQKHRRAHAMNEAQPGKADRQTVEPMSRGKKLQHRRR